MKRLLRFMLGLAASLALLPAAALAENHGKGNWRDHDGNRHFEHRDRDHGRDFHRNGNPPGWEHGRKTGWRGGNEPPGLARKHDRDFHGEHDRDRYRHHAYRRHHRPNSGTVAQNRPPVMHRPQPPVRTYHPKPAPGTVHPH